MAFGKCVCGCSLVGMTLMPTELSDFSPGMKLLDSSLVNYVSSCFIGCY